MNHKLIYIKKGISLESEQGLYYSSYSNIFHIALSNENVSNKCKTHLTLP